MIRRFQESDLETVSEIWLDTNIRAHSFIPAQYWKDQLEAVKEMIPQAEVYVYEDENKIQGFIGLNGYFIEGIFVRSEEQSKGIGRQLLDFVKEKKGRLSLSVYQKNTRAVRFYRREGFWIQAEGVDENTGEKEYTMVWKQQNENGFRPAPRKNPY